MQVIHKNNRTRIVLAEVLHQAAATTHHKELHQAGVIAMEAQRIKQRTDYDIEMMQELGYCFGIENYSRVISNRAPGSPPMTLLDYFPKDFLSKHVI